MKLEAIRTDAGQDPTWTELFNQTHDFMAMCDIPNQEYDVETLEDTGQCRSPHPYPVLRMRPTETGGCGRRDKASREWRKGVSQDSVPADMIVRTWLQRLPSNDRGKGTRGQLTEACNVGPLKWKRTKRAA